MPYSRDVVYIVYSPMLLILILYSHNRFLSFKFFVKILLNDHVLSL